jgi:hypothetical protein
MHFYIQSLPQSPEIWIPVPITVPLLEICTQLQLPPIITNDVLHNWALKVRSSLIAIIDNDSSQVVQFSHFSIKEFLTLSWLSSLLRDFSQYQILPGPAHTILAQACLRFLLHLDGHTDGDIIKGFPLAEYVARHWVTHAQFEVIASHVKDGMKS